MAETLKVLGQVDPSATTLTAAYTVPALTTAVISSITVANRSGAGTSYRISVAVAGAGDATKQYIAYDKAIAANAVDSLKLGITLGAGDVIRVYATLATLSFNIFGVENT